MKNRFSEYYIGNDEHFDGFFKNAIIVLDTNVLLNLYRFNNENRDKFFEILKKLEDKLYMTYHIGHEFFKNREEIIYSYKNYKKNVEEEIKKEITKIISSIEGNKIKGNEFLKHEKDLMNNIIKVLKTSETDIITILDDSKKNDSKLNIIDDSKKNDSELNILGKIESLYLNKVGEKLDEKELEAIYKEGKIRFENKTPPGYEDISKSKGKENNTTQYGDLVIWKEMIKYAKEKQTNVLFISDDEKEDWVRKIKGEKKGPRIELIKEFGKETAGEFYSLNSTSFIKKMSKIYNIKKTKELEKESNSLKRAIEKLEKERMIAEKEKMSQFILKSTYGDIEFAGRIISIDIKSHIELHNHNFEVAHLSVKTKEKDFLFRICADTRQGNDLNTMIDRIRKHFESCLANNKDYIIETFNERYYLSITNSDQDEYYRQQYTGELLN